MIYELHETEKSKKPEMFKKLLNSEGIDTIHASSQARLSKYHQTMNSEFDRRIYVIDPIFNQKPYPLEETTEIFKKYEQARFIERIYVNPNNKVIAQNLLKDFLKL
jgi:tRNA A37 N6-isopentenylltransferase MiaA